MLKIFVVIPLYNEASHVADVIRRMPAEVNRIIAIDDCSDDDTLTVVRGITDERIRVITHDKNQGVGGAMMSGYKYCLQRNADIIVKIDGDGQMDPGEIPRLITPLILKQADYVKGFRFSDMENLKRMPKIRLFGNIMLSFLTKIASGYWDIFDPTSGYTAIHKEALSRLNIDRLNKRYFFETDMLIHLYRIHAVVKDVEVSINYGNEVSQLQPLRATPTFAYRLIKAFFTRILWRYFLVDFTAVSLFILLGLPLLLYGTGFGIYHWISNVMAGISTPTGTIMIAVVSLFFGFQFLLQAVVLDIQNLPKYPLQHYTTPFATTNKR